MRIDSAFPSTYLKAADLQGRNVTVVMDHVKMEDIGDDHKPVLYFQGKERGLVLNKTNMNNIAAKYGYETDEWQGQPIELFEAMVDFQGKSVPAIRCRVPRQPQGNGAPKPRAASNGGGVTGRSAQPYQPPREAEPRPDPFNLDDEIPF